MADDIKVSPTPIQRNALDVAIELTQFYYQYTLEPVNSIQDIQETFAKMYAVATASQRGKIDGTGLLPESLLK